MHLFWQAFCSDIEHRVTQLLFPPKKNQPRIAGLVFLLPLRGCLTTFVSLLYMNLGIQELRIIMNN